MKCGLSGYFCITKYLQNDFYILKLRRFISIYLERNLVFSATVECFKKGIVKIFNSDLFISLIQGVLISLSNRSVNLV